MQRPLIRRVRIRNFKGIAACDVTLGRLNILVGRNGTGKSNFLEVLGFLRDNLVSKLDHTLDEHGGMESARHRGADSDQVFGLRIWLQLPDGSEADYGLELGSDRGHLFIRRERLEVRRDDQRTAHFYCERVLDPDDDRLAIDTFRASRDSMPPPNFNKLYLNVVTGPEFQPVLDSLLAISFCDPVPAEMRREWSIAPSRRLITRAANIASMIDFLHEAAPAAMQRVEQSLQAIVPHITGVRRVTRRDRETLEFKQERPHGATPWTFDTPSMSDGTLRALAILVALQGRGDRSARFLGIEDPRTASHPAAVGALLDALREASSHTQVILITHSADLLDRLDLDQENLLVAHHTGDAAHISLADPASSDAIRRHLFGAGELLRMDQLDVDRTAPLADLFDETDP